MQEVKVSFYLKRNEEKADGTVLILRPIHIGKSMVQSSIKVYVPASLWNTKSVLFKSSFSISNPTKVLIF